MPTINIPREETHNRIAGALERIAGRYDESQTAGSSANPVYFKDGVPKASEFEITPYGRNGIYVPKHTGVTIANEAQATSFLYDHGVGTNKFDGLFVGSKIKIQDGTYNLDWQIAGFNTHMNRGDTALTVPHIALVPCGALLNAVMNDTNVTTGGFKGSKMWTTTLPTVVANLQKALGSHLLTRRALLTKTVNTSTPSGAGAGYTGASTDWEWTDAKACLMSEVEVYGTRVFSSSFFDVGEACEKLPLYNFVNHVTAHGRIDFWLRAVSYSATFAIASHGGGATDWNASTSFGVVPLILLG